MVYWKVLPIALTPDEPYDNDGVFSGSVTITKQGPVIIYTGQSDTETQCIAVPKNISDGFKTINFSFLIKILTLLILCDISS